MNTLKSKMLKNPAVRAEYEALAPEYEAARAHIAGRDKDYDDSLSAALTDPNEAAAHIQSAIDQQDDDALLLALRQVAKAHDIDEVPDENGSPTMNTLYRVLRAAGLRLTVAPADRT